MKHCYHKENRESGPPSAMGTVFFVQKKVGEMMAGLYRRIGLIYGDKTYEIVDLLQPTPVIEDKKTKLAKLKKEKTEFLETKILPEKLEQEINSGTDGTQFVLRVMGMSNMKGADKNNMQPQDVYDIIRKRKP